MTESSDDKNPANRFGWTPLHSAAKHGQIKICQFKIRIYYQRINLERLQNWSKVCAEFLYQFIISLKLEYIHSLFIAFT